MSKKWIKGAIKHPGSFRQAAQKAGMSTMAYARRIMASPKASRRRKLQASLALTLSKLRKRRRNA